MFFLCRFSCELQVFAFDDDYYIWFDLHYIKYKILPDKTER